MTHISKKQPAEGWRSVRLLCGSVWCADAFEGAESTDRDIRRLRPTVDGTSGLRIAAKPRPSKSPLKLRK